MMRSKWRGRGITSSRVYRENSPAHGDFSRNANELPGAGRGRGGASRLTRVQREEPRPLLRFGPVAEQDVADRLTAAERVLQAARSLGELRNRLAELDRERAVVWQKIEQKLAEISGAPPPRRILQTEPSTLSEHILAVIDGDPGTIFTAMDFASRWKASEVNNYRSTLGRLEARGKIRRVSPGRYTALLKSSR